ncbi:Uncharacterized protein TCM_021171 [Theobroma cacao]|uniref:Uncharacterized protein n=1 Tax=Theobroma cacao TaxID=3641 RepID=A0A061EQ31_THECC|nr:Uncharacterized protein TCM_021171 [Theobroma cacao]
MWSLSNSFPNLLFRPTPFLVNIKFSLQDSFAHFSKHNDSTKKFHLQRFKPHFLHFFHNLYKPIRDHDKGSRMVKKHCSDI